MLGLIGAGGIGTMLSNYTNYREWDTVGMLLIVVVVITMLIDLVPPRTAGGSWKEREPVARTGLEPTTPTARIAALSRLPAQ